MKTDLKILKKAVKEYWQNMPFNIFLGMEIVSFDEDDLSLKFKMKDEFVGNYLKVKTLHGGVIASILDTTGGILSSIYLIKKIVGSFPDNMLDPFERGGTIDLRVDYLRPGVGETFWATGSVMRHGKKVTVTRMELFNDQEKLIAVGTGTYLVG